jgi:hypothetical protein
MDTRLPKRYLITFRILGSYIPSSKDWWRELALNSSADILFDVLRNDAGALSRDEILRIASEAMRKSQNSTVTDMLF